MFKPLFITALFCATVCKPLQAQNTNPAYKVSLDSLRKLTDPLKKEALILRLEKAYPQDNFEHYKYSLAYNFAEAKNTAKALTYFSQLKGSTREMAIATIPVLLMKTEPRTAETLVDKELLKQGNSASERLTLLDIKKRIRLKNGDYKNAFLAMHEIYNATASKSPVFTACYYYLMSKSGKQKEALPELEKAVAAGNANEAIKAELKTAWAKINPGKDAGTYLAALVKPLEDKYKAELRPRMVSKAAPNFTVTDINGKAVSLSDFKGKIVVLDFWATWCGPCKRGLPAMQMAVDKYKADPDVKFMFIHTFETSANAKEEAMEYLAGNDLRLPLYMDSQAYAGGKNPAAISFKLMAIPAKFIIDGQGLLRFEGARSGDTDEATANELSAMIELCRK